MCKLAALARVIAISDSHNFRRCDDAGTDRITTIANVGTIRLPLRVPASQCTAICADTFRYPERLGSATELPVLYSDSTAERCSARVWDVTGFQYTSCSSGVLTTSDGMETLTLEQGSCTIGCVPTYKVSTISTTVGDSTLFPQRCDGREWMNLENVGGCTGVTDEVLYSSGFLTLNAGQSCRFTCTSTWYLPDGRDGNSPQVEISPGSLLMIDGSEALPSCTTRILPVGNVATCAIVSGARVNMNAIDSNDMLTLNANEQCNAVCADGSLFMEGVSAATSTFTVSTTSLTSTDVTLKTAQSCTR